MAIPDPELPTTVTPSEPVATAAAPASRLDRLLGGIERAGNALPDPAMLFVVLLLVVWGLSALLSPVAWTEVDPRSGEPLRVQNLLSGTALAAFLGSMVTTFTGFHPLGVVLVSLLGVGVAEHTGFINAALKRCSPSRRRGCSRRC